MITYMEIIVEFLNERKEILRGILHTPSIDLIGGLRRLVVFPNGGIMGAEGDYRAHLSIARHLAYNGLYVLRFSPAGLGYSGGSIANCRQKDLFAQIETGLFVQDIKAAIKFIGSLGHFDSITLSGVCGGAISSYLAAAVIEEITGVIAIGIPVVLDEDNLDYSLRMPGDEAKLTLKPYLEKIFSWKAWMRLVLLKSDIKKIYAATLVYFSPNKLRYLDLEEHNENKFKINPYFIDASNKLLKKKKKILFIFGKNDGFWLEFEQFYLKRYFGDCTVLPFDYYLSPNANHMLTWSEMQSDVSHKIIDWINLI